MGIMPKGSGRVNCPECGATVAADGKGTPMRLKHAEGCSENRPAGYKPRHGEKK